MIQFRQKSGLTTDAWCKKNVSVKYTTPPIHNQEKWDQLTPKQRYKLNDGTLRTRIKEGDSFRYIGQDGRDAAVRVEFDLTASELLRLDDRSIPYEIVSKEEVIRILTK